MKRQRRLNKSMDTLFPQERSSNCRVCMEDVVDGRWNYCSERCREIAQAVQKMFLWDEVRERILERDEFTCNECGWSKEEYDQEKKTILEETEPASDERSRRWDKILSENRDMEVDHIKPLAEGGHPLDEKNLQTLCEDCHENKTARQNSNKDYEPDVTLDDYLDA